MIWTVTMVAVAAVVMAYLVRFVRMRLEGEVEASADRQAEEASDLRKLTNRALYSRPPRRAGEE